MFSGWDGMYHVELPWNIEVLKDVTSIVKVALAAIHRVRKSFEGKSLVLVYGYIFLQYLKERIFKPVQVPFGNF